MQIKKIGLPFHVPYSRTTKVWFRERQMLKQDRSCGWVFSVGRWGLVHTELADWMQHYAPIDLRGKTVLDVGAGQGETAKFYLEHGAAKVICVEPDPEHFRLLKYNAKFHPQIVPLQEYFSLKHLALPHDFLKMDIEGWEQQLLGSVLPKPAVLEIHGLQLIDAFGKAGFRLEQRADASYWLCYGYWEC